MTIAATDASNNCVLTIEKRGTGASSSDYYVRVLAGLTIPGYVDGQGSVARFNNPLGITLSKSGFLFVADTNNRRIRRLDLGGSVTTFSGSGLSGTQDASSPLGASFIDPYGIAAEPSGYLYVADITGRNIRRISPTGVVSTVAGTASLSGTGDGTGNTGTFTFPFGIAVGPGGDVLVTDVNRIRLLQRIITN
jgi:sugar lactone lactonase YvrE